MKVCTVHRNTRLSANRRHFIRLASCAGLMVATLASAQVPGILSYQGRIGSNGTNFNGAAEFKFALIESPSPEKAFSHWSNDETSLGGDEPVGAVPVMVQNGLFMVALGDTDLLNMETISAEVFANSDLYLRMWFSDGQNGFEQLTPDQPMLSVGYAMMAAAVPEGAIDGHMIAPGSVNTVHLENSIITEFQLADGSVTTPKLADGAVTGPKVAPNAIDSSHIVNNSVTSADVANFLTLEALNLGGLDFDGTLRLFSEPVGGGGIGSNGGSPRGYLRADNFGSDLSLIMGNGQTGSVISSRSPGGQLRLRDGGGTLTAFMGTVLGGGDLNLYQTSGQLGVSLDGDRATYDNRVPAGGEIKAHTRGGQVGVLVDGDHSNAGRIEVRQSNGTPYVDIFGNGANSGGEVRVKDTSGTTTVEILGAHTAESGGALTLSQADGTDTVILNGQTGQDGSGRLTLYQGDGDVGSILYGGANDGAGALSLRNTSGNARLRLYGGPDSGRMEILNDAGQMNVQARSYDGEEGVVQLYNKNGGETVYLWGRDSADADGGQIGLKDSDGTETLTLWASEVSDNGAQIIMRQGDGTATIVLDADQGGEGRIRCDVLQIMGGSDLSEQFDVAAGAATAEPGMLVCIDPNEPGGLTLSHQPYDRTAAGVISGAGNVKPGMLMGQTGTIADGQYPVALTGRVYCQVDAAYGAIEPGDLITTSATPGHGMKVADHERAQGAIVGKAMTGLESGQGLVLVLVSLQ